MTVRPKLPNPMFFEGIGICFWEGPPEYRCPNRNEFFVSGAIPQGYRARQHLTREYWIVRPTHYARLVKNFERGDPIAKNSNGVPIPRTSFEV